MHVFWVAGLLLALIDFPDVGGWLGRIAGSVEKIADNGSRDFPSHKVDAAQMPQEGVVSIKRADASASAKPERTSAGAGG